MSSKQYWNFRKNIEIYNIEIDKLLKVLSTIPADALSSKTIYDLAQIVVNREYVEMLIKVYEEEKE